MNDKTIRNISKIPLSEQLGNRQKSSLIRYAEKGPGESKFLFILKYELTAFLFSNLSGGLGYLLRKWFYSSLFRAFGKGIILGKGIVIRHPSKIKLGERVAIDDYSLLDASGATDKGIDLEDNVIISRNCVIQGKTGPIRIGQHTDIGCNTIITSGSGITIGNSVLIAANCYIGGGRYHWDDIDRFIMNQGIYSKGPILIGEGTWIGAGVIVLDGIHIGKGCIIGAGSVVTKNLPDYSIAVGVPARVKKFRNE